MTEPVEYVNAVGDTEILSAIDALLAERNFAKTVNPVFGTIRPISELASKYVKSALMNASKAAPDIAISEMNYYLTHYDPYYSEMSRICKNQLMHDSVDRILETLPEQAKRPYLERVSALVKSAKESDGEGYYITEAQFMKAKESGVPNAPQTEEGDTPTETPQTAGEPAGEMPVTQDAQVTVTPLPIDILTASDAKLADDSSAWREFHKRLNSATTPADYTDAFNKFCEDTGYTAEAVDQRVRALDAEAQQLQLQQQQNADPGAGKRVVTDRRGYLRSRRGVLNNDIPNPAVSEYLAPYIKAAAMAGQQDMIPKPLWDKWERALSDDVKSVYERNRVFQDKLGGYLNPDKFIRPNESLTTQLSSDKLTPEDKKAFAAIAILENIYMNRNLDFKKYTGLVPMYNQMQTVLGKTADNTPKQIMSELGLNKAEPYIKIVENYVEHEGSDNLFAVKWLFDFNNRNKAFNMARTPEKDEKELAFEDYFYREVIPSLSTEVVDKYFDEGILPDGVREEAWKKFDRMYEEHMQYVQEKRDDERDRVMWGNNLHNESFDSRSMQTAQDELEKDYERTHKPARITSEYTHKGDSMKAMMYRNRILDLLETYPFLDTSGYNAKALYVNQERDMTFGDEIVDFCNELARDKVRVNRSKGLCADYGSQLYNKIYGTTSHKYTLPNGDIDPRSIAELGVRLEPYTLVDQLPSIIAAGSLCTKGGRSGMARRCYGDAMSTLNYMLLTALRTGRYDQLKYAMLGKTSSDPFAILQPDEKVATGLIDQKVPFSVLTTLGASDKTIDKLKGMVKKEMNRKNSPTVEPTQFGLVTRWDWLEKEDKELAEDLLKYKAAQAYGIIGTRAVASRIAGNLLEKIQGKDKRQIGAVFNSFFKDDDASAKDAIVKYIKSLDAIEDILATQGAGLPKDLADVVAALAANKTPAYANVARSLLNSKLGAFFKGYNGSVNEDAFAGILDLESLPEIAKEELIPQSSNEVFLPTSSGWVKDHSVGDVLSQSYKMVNMLRRSIVSSKKEILKAFPAFKMAKLDALDEDSVQYALKDINQFFNKVGNGADYTKFKDLCNKITRDRGLLDKWRLQQNLAQSVWKNTLLMFTAPVLAPTANTVLEEAASSARRSLTSAFLSMIDTDPYFNRSAADEVASFFGTLGKNTPDMLKDKEAAEVLGYIYSKGGVPLSNRKELDLAPAERTRLERTKRVLKTYKGSAIKSAIDSARSCWETLLGEEGPNGGLVPTPLNNKDVGSWIMDLASWRSSDDSDEYECLPRLRFDDAAEVAKVLHTQILYRQITEEETSSGYITRERWVIKNYPRCAGTKEYPSAKKVFCEDIYENGQFKTRTLFDPSEPGELVTGSDDQGDKKALEGYYTSTPIYIVQVGDKGIIERYYDATYDAQTDDPVKRAGGYLGGLGEYTTDLMGGYIPYIEVKTAKKGQQNVKSERIRTASGTIKPISKALAQYHSSLKNSVQVQDEAWKEAESRAYDELRKSLMLGFGGKGVASALSALGRVLEVVDVMDKPEYDELKAKLPSYLTDSYNFFTIQNKIEKIWNTPESRDVKIEKTEKLIKEYSTKG